MYEQICDLLINRNVFNMGYVTSRINLQINLNDKNR